MTRFAVTAVLQLCVFIAVHATEILHNSVQYTDGIYIVEFEALVSAEQPEIYALLTDYNHLYLLNDTITESEMISEQIDLIKTCRLMLHICILYFCRDAVMVEDIRENGSDMVVATVNPARSDFSSGRSEWKILPAGAGQTRIVLRRTLEPSFWVPPLIGPWVIKNKMVQELSVMLERLEQYANAETGA